MTRDISPDIGKIRLLLTEPHDCSYLDNRQATTAFVDPEIEIDGALYGRMSDMGFRRSGLYLYSPLCSACNACVPARIPVDIFRPSRSQKRCLKRNSDITVRQVKNISFDEHYTVYDRVGNQVGFAIARHCDSTEDETSTLLVSLLWLGATIAQMCLF